MQGAKAQISWQFGFFAGPMAEQDALTVLGEQIADCRLCSERFAATETGHKPRPVAVLSGSAPILIAGQAPGARVHASGLPFDDRSGDRLRDWLGVDRACFYDPNAFAILPMAFCFPGYRKGADLPPPPICAKTWRDKALGAMPQVRLTLLIGGYAQAWHLKDKRRVNDRVQNWRAYGAAQMPLPHPSWRNTGWLKKNPWFEREAVSWLQARVKELLGHGS